MLPWHGLMDLQREQSHDTASKPYHKSLCTHHPISVLSKNASQKGTKFEAFYLDLGQSKMRFRSNDVESELIGFKAVLFSRCLKVNRQSSLSLPPQFRKGVGQEIENSNNLETHSVRTNKLSFLITCEMMFHGASDRLTIPIQCLICHK